VSTAGTKIDRDRAGPSRGSAGADPGSPGAVSAKRGRSSAVGVILISTLLFFALWQLVAGVVGSPYLPGPVETARALVDALSKPDFLGFTMWEHVRSSLGRIIIGFAAAALVAIPVGLVAGWFRFIETFASPWVEMTRPIPPLAWIPFAIVFFGTPLDAVFIVFLASFFPIYLNTVAGVKSVEPLLVDAARTLGARKAFLFTRVIIPGSLAHISIGLRLGLGYAWMSIVAAEILGVKGGGLGIYLWTMHEVGRFDAVFAGMVIIGVLGMLLTRGISFWRAAESV
jgi:NitT/TauT family transport system permease protein